MEIRGDTGFGDSNTFALDTTDTGTGGDTGFGDSNTLPWTPPTQAPAATRVWVTPTPSLLIPPIRVLR